VSARNRLAAAWPVANTSSPAPESLHHLNHHDRLAGIAFVCSYTICDVGTLRVFKPVRFARPNEPGPSVLMSDTAHRLAHLSTLCQLQSSLRASSGGGGTGEGAFLGICASLLDPGSRGQLYTRDSCHRLQLHSLVQATSSDLEAAAKLSRIATYRIASVCRRFLRLHSLCSMSWLTLISRVSLCYHGLFFTQCTFDLRHRSEGDKHVAPSHRICRRPLGLHQMIHLRAAAVRKCLYDFKLPRLSAPAAR
jgi:hypothetical protein